MFVKIWHDFPVYFWREKKKTKDEGMCYNYSKLDKDNMKWFKTDIESPV